MADEGVFDLIVVGGGIGGLASAALAQRAGLRCALLEAHTKLGGCAGYFGRGPYHFDAGATALMGLGAGEPLGDLLAAIGADFQAIPSPGYRVSLPDRELTIVPDDLDFESASASAFPGQIRSKNAFWRLQAAVGRTLFEVATRVPRLPIRSPGDLVYDLQILGLSGLLAASSWRSRSATSCECWESSATFRFDRLWRCSCRTRPRAVPRRSRSPTHRHASRHTEPG